MLRNAAQGGQAAIEVSTLAIVAGNDIGTPQRVEVASPRFGGEPGAHAKAQVGDQRAHQRPDLEPLLFRLLRQVAIAVKGHRLRLGGPAPGKDDSERQASQPLVPVQGILADVGPLQVGPLGPEKEDRKSTRLNSSHVKTSYAVFCLKKKKNRSPN